MILFISPPSYSSNSHTQTRWFHRLHCLVCINRNVFSADSRFVDSEVLFVVVNRLLNRLSMTAWISLYWVFYVINPCYCLFSQVSRSSLLKIPWRYSWSYRYRFKWQTDLSKLTRPKNLQEKSTTTLSKYRKEICLTLKWLKISFEEVNSEFKC